MLNRLILLLVVLCAGAVPALADQAVITSGVVQLGGGPVVGHTAWNIAGPGFSASGVAVRNTSAGEPCGGLPCNTGNLNTNISFGFVTADYINSATASFNGQSITVFGGIHTQPPTLGTVAQFFGSINVPIVTEDTLTIMAPFTMTGTVAGLGPVGSGIVLSVDFAGSGIASYQFTRIDLGGPNPGPRYVWRQTNYNFAEVPEPASMLLLGTGLTGLVAYARRRKGVKK